MTVSRGVKIISYFLGYAILLELCLQGFYYFTAGDFLFRRVGLPLYIKEPFAGYGNRPKLLYDHRTNEFHAQYIINDQGFRVESRDIHYAKAKPPNTYRIMLLGPSFTFGWAVNYQASVAGLLTALLHKKGFMPKKNIEIINAGVPAIPPTLQLNWYNNVGRKYAPDLVIQFIYGSMAVGRSSRAAYEIDDDGNLIPAGAKRSWQDYAKNFATIFYGWMAWAQLRKSLSTEHPEAGHGQVDAILGAGRELAVPREFNGSSPLIGEAMRFYRQLANDVRESGGRLLIVFVPLSYAIHPEDESRWRHLGVRDVEHMRAFEAAFIKDLNSKGISTIDLTPALRKRAQSGVRLYYWLDIHWTAAGNAVAARAIAEFISGNKSIH